MFAREQNIHIFKNSIHVVIKVVREVKNTHCYEKIGREFKRIIHIV
jgi:hypothetical protein